MKRRHAYAVYLLTGFCGGLLFGAACVMLLIGQKLDDAYRQVSYFQAASSEKDVRLQKLEDSFNTRQFILKKVEVHLQCEGDSTENTGLEKYIKDRCHNLLGKKVNDIDTDLILEMLDNRIIRLNNIDYKLTVQRTILSDILQLWVKVTVEPSIK